MWSRINVWLVVATCGMGIPTAGVGQERVRVTLPGEAVVGVGTRTMPNGNTGFVLGAKLQF